jgi:ATP-dependent helicase/nuclease subunit A
VASSPTADQAARPQDDAERRAALDVRRSFIVQAPAGSGKTELLVRRFVNLLSIVESPEEILAITFTRKAAAEMRSRVLATLKTPEIAHRLRIQTIDSLCTALTRQMPVLARFGAQPEIVEDASDLYREAASRVLRDFNDSTEKLLRHLDNNVAAATTLLADMLHSRDRWLRKTGAAPTRSELEASFLFERTRLLAKARALHPGASEDLAKELLTKECTWRKKHPLAQSLSDNEPLRQALAALCRMPPQKYDDRQWEALEAILSLLFPAISNLKVIFGEQGKADFTEFVHGALRALGAADEPSDLLLSIDRKISHILVDEFQDTSRSQYELLMKLTSGWEPGDGRTLFLVGDPMQSIYRFREAEVSLFLNIKHIGLGSLKLEPLTLTTNFRSQQNLVTWFNDSFSRVLPSSEDEAAGAVPYSPATSHHPALPGPAVSWHGFYDREEEAERVVSLVKSSPGKKAILVRNRAHLDEIVPALNDAGVRFRAVEIERLGEKQVVQDLYALTRVLSHLGDRVAALACLRAPWCGLLLEDLLLLVSGPDLPKQPDLFPSGARPPDKGGGSSATGGFLLVSDLMRNVSHLSHDGQTRVARVREVLDASWRDRHRGTLRDRVEGAWLALGGPACLADATELEDAEIFLDELERLEHAGLVDLAKLKESIGELYALPDVDAGPDAVEIMTIHKAKGLEFDTVIVPGLDRIPRSGFKPLFAWKSLPDSKLLLAPINETGTDKEPAYNYIRELEKEAQDIEAGRLFYVAATRAKQRLHLLAKAIPNEDGLPKEPNKRSLLGKIWWQAQPHFGPAPSDLSQDTVRDPIHDILRRLPADFQSPAAPTPTKWTAPEEGRDETEIEFSWVGETARHVGTVVHRWLQRIADDELQGWDAKRVDGLTKRFTDELRRRGVQAADAPRSAEFVATALKNSLADERGRWILSPHPEARSEYRMRVRSEKGTRHYVMDRVFKDKGVLWIVDYKTSGHEGSNVEAFLDRERDRYAVQLGAYSTIFVNSCLGLYFPLLRGWRPWTH